MKIKGFTLIECVVALTAICLFFLAIPSLIQQSNHLSQLVFGRTEQEWHVFLLQAENKLMEGESFSVQRNGIFFKKKNNEGTKLVSCSIDYSATSKLIVIRENAGYEPVLLEVQQAKFSQQDQHIYFEVLLRNGEQKTGKWTIPKA